MEFNYKMKNWYSKALTLSIAIFFAAFSFVASTANAKVIAQCGASTGYVAYLRNGVLGSQGDFAQDRFTESKIVLEAQQNSSTGDTEVDVIFINAGTPYRASDDGPVYLVNHNPTNNTWMVLAVANTYIDTYLFYLDDAGRGEVVWTNARSGGTPKAVLMRAKCG